MTIAHMKTIFSIFVLCFACDVAASSKECDEVYVLAASAVSNRDEGMTQEQLRRPLPPRHIVDSDIPRSVNERLKTMHEIVDEIYIARDLDEQTYAVFKSEQCRLRKTENLIGADFQKVVPVLQQCVPLKGNAKIYCAIRAAESVFK